MDRHEWHDAYHSPTLPDQHAERVLDRCTALRRT